MVTRGKGNVFHSDSHPQEAIFPSIKLEDIKL